MSTFVNTTFMCSHDVLSRQFCNSHKLKHLLKQVGGFLRVLRFPPQIKLTATI